MQQLQAAVALHNQGDLGRAEAIYRQVLEVDADNFYALNFCGCVCRERKNFAEGIDFLRRAVSLQPVNPDAIYNLGNIFKSAERWEEAISCYEKTLSLRPEYPEALNNLGVCLKEVERYEHSEIALGRVVEMRPDYVGGWMNLGNTLREQGKCKEAILVYYKAIELKVDFVDAYLNLANLLSGEGELDEAIACYRKVTDLKPDSADAYWNLANLLREIGELDEAIACYRKVTDLKPDFADAFFRLYLSTSFLGQHDEALNALMMCLKVDPDHYDARQSIGFAFFQADRKDNAIKYFADRFDCFDFVYYANLFRALKGEVCDKLINGVDIKSRLVAEILAKIKVSQIEAFGDSHVNVFKDIRGISVNYLGPSTAYNLSNPDSSTGGGERLKKRLDALDSRSTAILLCFGEIDCRSHIVKQAFVQKKPIHHVALGVAKSYLDFALFIKSLGFEVIIYGPYGSGSQFNSFGLEQHRNKAVKFLNDCLQEICIKNGIYFFSLNHLLVDPLTFFTRQSLLVDDVHLPVDGQQSDQAKVLLLSSLLLDVQSREQELDSPVLPQGECCIKNVCAFGVSCTDKSSYIYFCMQDGGLIQWPSIVDCSIENICFDLGSSLPLKRAFIGIECSKSCASHLEFAIDGIKVEVLQEIDSFQERIVVDFHADSVGRFLVISGYKKLTDIRSICFIPAHFQVD